MLGYYAAENGHIEIFKWIVSNNLSWEPERAAYYVAEHGQFDLLKWLLANGANKNGYGKMIVLWICVHVRKLP